MGKHVIAGSGQVGSHLARLLAGEGHQVVVISRSGSGATDTSGVTAVAADAADGDRLADLANGADALYNCVNPAYHRWLEDWPPIADSLLHAAEVTGAGYVLLGNLYVYAPSERPIRETDPLEPSSEKARVRARMWQTALAAHEAGRVRVTEIRGSDYFGPGCRSQSHLGERFVPRLLGGKPAQFVVEADQPHSWTYVPDVARALATAATDDRSWGRAWHVPTSPPLSAREVADRLCGLAGVPNRGITVLPRWLVRALGLVDPMLGEIEAVRYQFRRPFVVDSAAFQAEFGITPTPIDDALAATIDWWRQQAHLA